MSIPLLLIFCSGEKSKNKDELCECYEKYLELYKSYDFEKVLDDFQFELDFQKKYGYCTKLFFKETDMFAKMTTDELIEYDKNLKENCPAFKQLREMEDQANEEKTSPMIKY